MSSSKLPSSTHGSMSSQNRPIAKFPPNIWGDIFLNPIYNNIDERVDFLFPVKRSTGSKMLKEKLSSPQQVM
ncbi:hypothetical protein V6N13_087980 [Hibiscus sabdariffa]